MCIYSCWNCHVNAQLTRTPKLSEKLSGRRIHSQVSHKHKLEWIFPCVSKKNTSRNAFLQWEFVFQIYAKKPFLLFSAIARGKNIQKLWEWVSKSRAWMEVIHVLYATLDCNFVLCIQVSRSRRHTQKKSSRCIRSIIEDCGHRFTATKNLNSEHDRG